MERGNRGDGGALSAWRYVCTSIYARVCVCVCVCICVSACVCVFIRTCADVRNQSRISTMDMKWHQGHRHTHTHTHTHIQLGLNHSVPSSRPTCPFSTSSCLLISLCGLLTTSFSWLQPPLLTTPNTPYTLFTLILLFYWPTFLTPFQLLLLSRNIYSLLSIPSFEISCLLDPPSSSSILLHPPSPILPSLPSSAFLAAFTASVTYCPSFSLILPVL